MAGDPPPRHLEAHEEAGRAGLGDAPEGVPPDEIDRLVEAHDPAEVRLVRVDRGVEVVAVQRHAGLEAQRVAGAEADRDEAVRRAGRQHRVPQLAGAGGLDEDLEAILAGVAGPGDEGRDSGDGPLGDPVVADPGEVEVGQRGEDLHRPGTLDGDERGGQRAVVEDRPERLDPLGEQVADERGVARVGDDEEALLGEPVDDQVVEDPAVRGADHRILGPADGQPGRLRDDGSGERLAGVGPLDEQLAHVRQVEEPGAFTDGPMLLDDPAVLEGHLPAAEGGHLGAERLVPIGERAGVGDPLGRRVAHVDDASATTCAARSTRARSVSKVSSPPASARSTQRTSSNSWSWRVRSPPVGSIRK